MAQITRSRVARPKCPTLQNTAGVYLTSNNGPLVQNGLKIHTRVISSRLNSRLQNDTTQIYDMNTISGGTDPRTLRLVPFETSLGPCGLGFIRYQEEEMNSKVHEINRYESNAGKRYICNTSVSRLLPVATRLREKSRSVPYNATVAIIYTNGRSNKELTGTETEWRDMACLSLRAALRLAVQWRAEHFQPLPLRLAVDFTASTARAPYRRPFFTGVYLLHFLSQAVPTKQLTVGPRPTVDHPYGNVHLPLKQPTVGFPLFRLLRLSGPAISSQTVQPAPTVGGSPTSYRWTAPTVGDFSS
ncbi:hypothetical protein B0H16DRAFT_1461023 [Mycena metata]|uniref:Uncharacterized protein n=1 Tax=Mycena metata TaxID=1033252 RepID=A0AAD7IVJ9_9AGAR|nr:hypothetical protein B0H16DRAFT_1461023 [Mycena metata]